MSAAQLVLGKLIIKRFTFSAVNFYYKLKAKIKDKVVKTNMLKSWSSER